MSSGFERGTIICDPEQLALVERVPIGLFRAIDLDRTLIDTDNVMPRFIATADEFGIDVARVLEEQSNTEAEGGTFSPLGFVRRSLNPEKFEALRKRFVTRSDPEWPILFPDGKKLLEELRAKTAPYAIPTYGVEEGQIDKLLASGYQGYAEIMDQPQKGLRIESWRNSKSQTFDFVAMSENGEPLVVVCAKSVELTDDKGIAFEGLPDDCTGKWLVRGSLENLLPSQRGEVDQKHVSVISNLGDLAINNVLGNTEFADQIAGFRPAYADGGFNPGVLFTPSGILRTAA